MNGNYKWQLKKLYLSTKALRIKASYCLFPDTFFRCSPSPSLQRTPSSSSWSSEGGLQVLVRGTSGHCGGRCRRTWRMRGRILKKRDPQKLCKLLSINHSKHFLNGGYFISSGFFFLYINMNALIKGKICKVLKKKKDVIYLRKSFPQVLSI